jgi:hypothetical protein
MMTVESLKARSQELTASGVFHGFRFVDHSVSVGDALRVSYNWDGDVMTDDELPGTCAFSSLRDCLEYAKYSKGIDGSVILISGEDKGCGTDFGSEIYVGDAVVEVVVAW